MDLEIIKVGPLETNCYIIKGDKAIVIDPGDEASKIIAYLEKNNYDLGAILITHYHFDHIGALDDLSTNNKVNIYDYHNIGEYNICGFNVSIIPTNGHTMDSVTYYFKDYKTMFVGDFIFKNSIGRTDLGGSDTEMLKSLSQIKEYPLDTVLYPGHGDKTTLKEEIMNNYYLR